MSPTVTVIFEKNDAKKVLDFSKAVRSTGARFSAMLISSEAGEGSHADCCPLPSVKIDLRRESSIASRETLERLELEGLAADTLIEKTINVNPSALRVVVDYYRVFGQKVIKTHEKASIDKALRTLSHA